MTATDIGGIHAVYVDKWLPEYFKANEIKYATVARLLGMDSSILTYWCRGKRPVPMDRLRALVDALNTLTGSALSVQEVVGWANRDGDSVFASSVQEIDEPVVPRPGPLSGYATAEPVVEAEPEPVVVGPSVYPLAWCGSTHGTGVYRVHHHGPSTPWAPGFWDAA